MLDAPRWRYRVEPLARQHQRTDFRCGVEALDRYLATQASQDARRHFTSVFVAVHADTGSVVGFYTLSMAGVPLEDVPATVRMRMARYPSVPAVRLGRLAVATACRGQGLGGYLLTDAMHRALQVDIAWVAFVVDAKDDGARGFYQQYGFLALRDDSNHLFLPRDGVSVAVGGGRR